MDCLRAESATGPQISHVTTVWANEMGVSTIDVDVSVRDPDVSHRQYTGWDGCRLRCVVTDAAGTQIVSREAILRVRDRVDTGDDTNLPLYLALALALLIALRSRTNGARR